MRNSRLENEILQRVDELVQCAISVSLKDEATRAAELTRGIAMVQEMGDLLLEVLEGREQHLQALLEQLVAQRLPDRRILQSFGHFPRDIQHIISEGVSNYLKTREERNKEQSGDGASAPANATVENAPNNNVPAHFEEATPGETTPPVPGEAAGPAPAETPAQPLGDTNEQLTPEAAPAATLVPEMMIVSGEPAPVTGPEEIPVAGASPRQALEALHLALLQAYPEEEISIDYEIRGGTIPFFLPRLQIGFEPAGLRHDWRYEFYCRQQGISIRQVAADELANPAYLARRLRREASWRREN